MSSVEPDEHADQQDAGQKRAGKLVEAGGNGAIVLDLVEEAFDEVALAIECEVGLARRLSVRLRGDDWC